jgi:hypothetical protein
VEDKPKRTPTNFGAWYWIHLVVMLAWSAVCLGSGNKALRAGQLTYGAAMLALFVLGLICFIAWYPLQDRQPKAEDRLHRLPLIVLGVFDALVLGGGILIQEIHVRLTPSQQDEASIVSLIIGGLCVLVGIGYVRSGLAERRALRVEQEAKPEEPEPKPEEPDEPAED